MGVLVTLGEVVDRLGRLRAEIAELEILEKQFKDTAEKMNIAPGQVMQLFRVLVSGVGGGPALFEMMEWMGKDSILARFEKALNTLPTV